MEQMKWVNGDLVISGHVDVFQLEGMMEYYKCANGRNQKILQRAEVLARMMLETETENEAIREVAHYLSKHPRYEDFGKPLTMRDVKNIVSKAKQG